MLLENNHLIEEIEKKYSYEKLANDLNRISKFTLAYSEYIYTARDYGTGDCLSMLEAHVLSDIVNKPGITVTELSKVWDRTKSAISQTVKKLMQKDYVYRVNSADDGKVFHLYPNESAICFAQAHKEFDRMGMYRSRIKLLDSFTDEEIDTFYRIAEEYTRIIKETLEKEQEDITCR